LLVASLEIDLEAERQLLGEGVGIEQYEDSLLRGAGALTAAGADFLAIACNTLHVLYEMLQEQCDVPVLHICDAVARGVERVGASRVGLLSTMATARTGVYELGLEERGIEVVNIDTTLQRRLADAIRDEVTQKELDDTSHLRSDILATFEGLGADAVIAGCTELKALMVGWDLPLTVIDSLDCLGEMVFSEMARDVPEGLV
jgi:aspartate racemase